MPFSSPTPPSLSLPPTLYPHPLPSNSLSPCLHWQWLTHLWIWARLEFSWLQADLPIGSLCLAPRWPVIMELELLAKQNLSHLLCLLSWPFCVWYHVCAPVLWLTLLCLKTIRAVTGFKHPMLLGIESCSQGVGLRAACQWACVCSAWCHGFVWLFLTFASLHWGQRICNGLPPCLDHSSSGRLASASGQPERESWRLPDIDKGVHELNLGRGNSCGTLW